MSYLVLARKWRPKTFDDVIGQEYITQTLKNAVSLGKMAHALIFSGPRGVGKTSSARIIAKALNCEKGPTPEPCSVCTYCREISEGKSLDVIEIDAASHTGVNDVREIIENIKYLPSSGKTKIYIIDEAHMLSQSAFNALLKTLEEPPPHVLFILATTEVHKIPVTILSRCQRYDFKKVSTEKIKERLYLVTSSEGIKISDETLYLIAQEADGGLRDALSLLDQLVATFGTEIKHEDVTKILGILDRSLIKSTLVAIFNKDPKSCIETLNEVSEKGISPKRFAEELLKTLRNTLVIKACGKEVISDLSDDEKEELKRISANQSLEGLELLFSLMLEGAEDVQKSFYPRMALEVTLVKLALLNTTVPLDDILNKIETLYRKISSSNPSRHQVSDPTKKEIREAPKPNDYTYGPGSDNRSGELEGKSENSPRNSGTEGFVKFVKSQNSMIGIHLEKANKVDIENSAIRIQFANQSIHSDYLLRKESQESLKKLSKEFFSQDLRVRVDIESSDRTDLPNSKEQNAKNRDELHKDPIVQDALEIFGGRIVRTKIKEKE
ncbi:MAG: DNA polymerase III subunit gamma/tau [Deltaproteobacteria bacterium]|nr:DNA polymerase III subunit gamma/tau [Deltaproteobacteria bacterium]